ncbi:MAG: alkaline phosphatase family protein [Chloroflexi bacterium]|nr:alkaline phosphatase family protein [Chloroflexota bacterium]
MDDLTKEMMDNEPMARRVLVLAWDGATLDLARPWIEQGKLPNLKRMAEMGTHGELASTEPPISAPAWASFMTGSNPGQHGIYHFQEHVEGTYRARLLNGGDITVPTLWRILSDAGRRVAAINVAMTFPPETVNGILIAGVDAPGAGSVYTSPPGLAQELAQSIGEYIIEPGVIEHVRRDRHDLALRSILHALEQRIKVVDYLLAREHWDLFVVNYRASDNVQHHFWHFMDATHPLHDARRAASLGDAILRVYQRLDEHVGQTLDRMGSDTTLVVMSDHGFGPASPKALYLNRWLAREGYLRFAGRGEEGTGWHMRLRRVLWNLIWGPLRRYTSKRTKDGLRRLFPALYDRARTPASYFSIDWAHTRAYSDEYRPVIWINLQGREPQGTIQPGAAYEALRDELIERLLALRDPSDGQPVVWQAQRREEVYHGAQLHKAPDIVLALRQAPYVRSRLSPTTRSVEPLQELTPEQLKADYLPQGLHRDNGMLFMAGAGIRPGLTMAGAQIVDLAPTILHLLGLPVPSTMDGRVLQEALTEARPVTFLEAGAPAAVRAGRGYSDIEEDLVRDKLEGLGYLG